MGVSFGVVEVTCPEAMVRERLERRIGEPTPSDAYWEIYLAHKKDFDPVVATPPTGHFLADTSQPLDEVGPEIAEEVLGWLITSLI